MMEHRRKESADKSVSVFSKTPLCRNSPKRAAIALSRRGRTFQKTFDFSSYMLRAPMIITTFDGSSQQSNSYLILLYTRLEITRNLEVKTLGYIHSINDPVSPISFFILSFFYSSTRSQESFDVLSKLQRVHLIIIRSVRHQG